MKKITGLLLIVLCCLGNKGYAFVGNWYSQGTTNANIPASWNSATDGSGTIAVASDFTTGGNTWNIQSTMTLSGSWNITANCNVVIASTGSLSTGSNTISIGGNWTNSGTFSAGTGTVNFVATSTGHTLNGSMTGSNRFYNLTFNSATGAWSFGANAADVSNTFTITNTAAGGVTAPSSTLKLAGNFLHTTGVFLDGGGTVEFNGTTGQTMPGATTMTFNNLNISNTGGPVNATNAITVNGTLQTAAGATLNMLTFQLLGAFTPVNNGTIRTSCTANPPIPSGKTYAGTVIYGVATAGQSIVTETSYENLIINNTGGVNIATGTITATTLTVATGVTLDMATFVLNLTTTPVANNGTIQTQSAAFPSAFTSGKTWGGTVKMNAVAGPQYIPAATFNNLTLGNTSGIEQLKGSVTVNGALVFAGSGTGTLFIDNLVTLTLNGTVSGMTATNCITGNSTANITIGSSGSLGTLFFDQATPGTATTSGSSDNIATFTVNSGASVILGSDLSVNASLVLNGTGTISDGGHVIKINGAIQGTGTHISSTGGKITVISPFSSIANGNMTFGNLELNYPGVSDFSMTGSPTINGSLTFTGAGNRLAIGANTLTLNGTVSGMSTVNYFLGSTSSNLTLGGSGVIGTLFLRTFTPSNTINKLIMTNGGTATLGSSIIINNLLDLASTGTGGKLVLASGTTLTLAGTFSTSATQYLTADPSNNIIISSTSASAGTLYFDPAASTFNTLTVSGSGGVSTLGNNISVTTLALTAGTLADGGTTITVTGNITGTGTHSGTGGINMTGSGATISGATLGNLNLNNAGGFSLTGSTTINGTLTLSSGKLTIGTNTLNFGVSAPAVASTFSSAVMIVANGTGTVLKKFSATGSFLFPIGDDLANYTPITLNFTGGTFAAGAYAMVNVTKAKQPQNANTTDYLNRYWSVTTSGITSPVYSVSATYVTGDVVGTEANISMGEYPLALPWIKYGATNTGTHTLSATGVTEVAAKFTGISTANPTVSVLPSTATICSGGSVTLVATGSGNPTLKYSWSPATGLSSTTLASVVASPTTGTLAATYIYTVTMTDGNGFIATAMATVNVNPTAVISGNTNVCVGATTTLGTNIAGGTWLSSVPAKATIGSSSGIVTGIAIGTTNISYTLGTGCRAIINFTVNTAPSISGATNNGPICAGTTLTLSANGASNVTGYLWSGPVAITGAATASASVPSATTAASGTYTVTVNNGGSGCSASYTTTAVVNATPTVAAITGTMIVCAGSTTTLSNTTSGGVWSSSTPSVAAIGTSGIVSGVTAGTSTITYSVTNGFGCNAIATTEVTVNASPTVAAITGTLNVCVGSTTTLSNTTSGGVWSSSTTSVATIGTSGIVSGVTAGTSTITYSVTNGFGCNAIATTEVTVNALPTVATITGTLNVCIGATTTLSNTTSGGVWSSNVPSVATIGTSGVVSGVATGTTTITYSVTNGFGCNAIATTDVTVNALPTVAAITGTLNVCVGATTALSNTTTGGVWSSGTPSVATIGTSGIVSGLTAGTSTITYSVTNGFGCSAIATADVTVNALPTVAAITGTLNVCVGATTTLSNTTTGGVWSSSTTSVATIGTSGIVSGVSAGTTTITYSVTNGFGCNAIATTEVTVNALPTVAAITGTMNMCVGSTTTLSNTTSGGVWSSSTPSVATIGTSGIVSGVSAGTSTIIPFRHLN